MFEQTFVDGGKTRKGWTVLVSFIAQMIVLAIAILIPMIYFDALPKSQLTSFLVAPPPPPPPPPPPAAAPPKVVKIIPRQFDAGRLMAPKAVPKEVAMIKEEELPPPSSGGVVGGVPGGVPGGTAGGVIGGIIGSVPTAAPPPPPPPPSAPKPVTPQPIRSDRNVQQAKLFRPAGRAPLVLCQSAMEAVKQWVYQPTLLNGEAVEVVTQIDVNFTLSQ